MFNTHRNVTPGHTFLERELELRKYLINQVGDLVSLLLVSLGAKPESHEQP